MVGPFDAALKDLARIGRSDTSPDHASTSSAPSRISLLPSVRLPSFGRQETPDQVPVVTKKPLLTLRLSSRSFIDTNITDDISETPLYTTKTVGACTNVSRSSTTGGQKQFATVRWPKVLPTKIKGRAVSDGVEIQMGTSRYLGGETLLKYGPKANSARRFQIPNYPNQLKWKRRGDIYWCTTASLKGRPIAILEPAKDKTPPKLIIYETLRDRYNARGILYYEGVYILLMDYLVITAMLLVTELQEWMLVKIYEEKSVSLPNPVDGGNSSVEASASQWRKIMYREPIYPKLNGSSTHSTPSTPDSHSFPPTPISDNRLGDQHSVGWGSSVNLNSRSSYQTTDPSMSMLSLSDSEDEDNDDDEMEAAVVHTRAGSPAGSTYDPGSHPHPPSHNYIDPTFYPSPAPPVPPLPIQYARSNQNLRGDLAGSSAAPSATGTTSTASSPLSQHRLRELPRTPSRQSGASPRSASLTRMQASSASTSASQFETPAGHDRAKSGGASSSSATSSPTPAAVIGRTRSMTTGGHRSRSPRPLPSVPGRPVGPAARPQTSSSMSGGATGLQSRNTLRRAKSHATFALEEEQVALQVPPSIHQGRYFGGATSPPPPLPTSSSAGQRSLPPTPMTMAAPGSPHPDMMQEELRVAAATVHMLRSQQQQQHHHHAHHRTTNHPPTLAIPASPPRKGSRTLGVGGDVDGDEDAGGEAHWVLASPSGRTLPPLPAPVYDFPPPAYAESEAAYQAMHGK